MGGEPLAQQNLFLTELVIKEVKKAIPDIKIALWTGYTLEELQSSQNSAIKFILKEIDTLVDGPFIQEQRDTTLPMRGSSNQRILNLKELRKQWEMK